jgi:DMSO/TMAO reductase YedYZ molybdopterin-dependent catalytic subunit
MSSGRKERSIEELYNDPERGDALVFGRRTDVSRRGFLGDVGLTAMGVAVGASIPFSANMPAGLIPAALAQGGAGGSGGDKPAQPAGPQKLVFPGKDPNLLVVGDKPLNAETPPPLLDGETTAVEAFYIRNNGTIPDAPAEPDKWVLKIDGEVDKPLEITLGELKSKFPVQEQRVVLECGGNGRAFFNPPARGNQWTTGAVGCAVWKGVRLADLLKTAGLKSSAVYTGNYGADQHLSGDPGRQALSRGTPIAKAMDEDTLLVWEMNGKPLINVHGAPLRLVVPGWVGSCSHKWLNRITVRDKVHDGQGMGGFSYRVPTKPIVPGSKGDEADTRILEEMPVRSVITSPANGTKLAAGSREIALRGAAWSSDKGIREVEVSNDFGVTWQKAKLEQPKGKYDWSRWTASLKLPSDGYFEIWARATDGAGVTQPFIAGAWNPQGYGGNSYHRIAVLVG